MEEIDRLILVSKILYNERNVELRKVNKKLEERSIDSFWLYILSDHKGVHSISMTKAEDRDDAIEKISETKLALTLIEDYYLLLSEKGETEFPSEVELMEMLFDKGQLKLYNLSDLQNNTIAIDPDLSFFLLGNNSTQNIFDQNIFCSD